MMITRVYDKAELLIVSVTQYGDSFDLVFKKETRELFSYINGELTNVHGKEFFSNREKLVGWPLMVASGFYTLALTLCDRETVYIIALAVKRASISIGAKEELYTVEQLMTNLKEGDGQFPDYIHPHYATAVRDAVILLAGITANPYREYTEEEEVDEPSVNVYDTFDDLFSEYVIARLVDEACYKIKIDSSNIFIALKLINEIQDNVVTKYIDKYISEAEYILDTIIDSCFTQRESSLFYNNTLYKLGMAKNIRHFLTK